MTLRRRTIVKFRQFVLVCFLISIPFNILGYLLRVIPLLISGLVMVTIAVITSLIFWRCPRCKRRLPMRINAKDANNDIDGHYVCPYCTMQFSDRSSNE